MKHIYFYNSWGEAPKALLDRFNRQTPDNAGVWKNITGTDSFKKADYCIVLGGKEPEAFNFDPLKTLYIKREPDFIDKTIATKIKYNLTWQNSFCGITWWLNRSFDQLSAMPYPDKDKRISCIVSAKHQHREGFIKKIFMTNNTGIDLFGRGHNKANFGEDYKGELNYDGNCKLEGLLPYEYSIVLENSQEKNYWTEKLADAYLSWCLPIYWGCPNLADFFHTASYKHIMLDDPDPLKTIKNIIAQPVTPLEIEAIADARDKILNQYNIWEVIRKQIEAIENEVL
jgi:hypothetical protein